ncbi:MAG: TerC family protein [Verrucomicrobia bacterium]|nr:TerC family protein [Verrucomicrobiota bacterium]
MRIVFLDLALAGDNAVVIALAVRGLPARDQFLGRVFGTVGAIVLRLIFVVMVTHLLRVPFLQSICGMLLIWIAVKLVRPNQSSPDDVRSGSTLKEAIWVIVVADMVMSLDNVLAISAAAAGDMVLVTFGLLLSIPLVVWGSGILARLMHRFPLIIWIGGGVLGFVAGDLVLKDPLVHPFILSMMFHEFIPYVLGFVVSCLGWFWSRSALVKSTNLSL